MVGVPGRSKGCKTCRKRKKGCDLQQPACGNCIRGGLICGGYARQWTFIANEPVTRGNATAVLARRSPAKSPLIFLPDQLNRSAFENQSLSIFFDLYFPASQPKSSTLHQDFRNWITVVQELDLKDAALRPALLAFCLARIGAGHDDRDMSEQALRIYGTALKEMNLALRDGKRIHTDETLAAGKLMAHYEMLHGSTTPELKTRGANWKAHTEGVMKLIQIRGPGGLSSENAHLLFVDIRCAAIINAIVTRKPNFFATDAWRTMSINDEPKDASDELHDIMATIPILLEEYDLLQACQDEGLVHQRRLRLFQQCRATDHVLRNWFANLSSILPRPLPSAIMTPAEQECTAEQVSDDHDADEERERLQASIEAMSQMGMTIGKFLTSLQAASMPSSVGDESEIPWRARSRLWFRERCKATGKG
ncbi:MAG: hypothetical protein Q9168_006317 [Polycauliona sp. 1 TL-2023]